MSELVLKIENILLKARKKYISIQFANGIMLSLSSVFLAFLFSTLITMLFAPSSLFRTVLLSFCIGISLLFLWKYVVSIFVNKISTHKIALLFEEKYPELNDILISAYELLFRDNWKKYQYSEAIVKNIGDLAIERSQILDNKRILPYRKLENSFRLLLFSGLLLILLFTIFPLKSNNSFYYLIHPSVEIDKTCETRIVVYPGDTELVKYGSFNIRANARGRVPAELKIIRRFKRGKPVEDFIQMDNDTMGLYKYTIDEVRQDFEYSLEGGEYQTPWYKATVIDKPRILSINLTFSYPKYTRMKPQVGERNDGTVDVLKGTTVKINARASKKLNNAKIVFSTGEEIELAVEDKKISGNFIVRNDNSYQIICEDIDGVRNPEPITYKIFAREDQYPTLSITIPGQDVDLTEELKLPLQAVGQDDFGFSTFQIAYYITETDTLRAKLPFKAFGQPNVIVEFLWNLSSLNLLPEDVVYYWIEAFDNDIISGPKSTRSRTYAARFPSLMEIVDDVQKEQNAQEDELSKMIEESKKMSEEFKEISKELKATSNMEYEQREDLKSMMEKHQKMVENIENLAEKLDESINKIEQNKLAAQEIVDKMRQIQDILEDIATPEMKEAMQEMQEALSNMDMEQLKKAMGDFELSQKEFMDNLDRTLELLKRMQMEQKLSQLQEMTEQAKETQENIDNEMNANSDAAERKQNNQTERMKAMEKSMKDLAEMMKDFDDAPEEMADSISQQMDQMDLPKQSENMSQNMKSGNKKGCKKQSDKMKSDLDKLSQSLKKMQEKMNQNLMDELKEKMTNSAQKLNYLSKRQEDLFNKACNSNVSREQTTEIAREQMQISQNLEKITEDIADIASQTMFLPPGTQQMVNQALRESQLSMDELAKHSCRRASSYQQNAMSKMNQASSQLVSSMNNMCNSSSCPSGCQSMMQQMQSMCQGQQNLNSQTMPMMNSGQPGGMTPDQMAAAQKLAAEQDALRKSLEQLAQEAEGTGELLGKFDNAVNQMKEVTKDLQKGNVTKRTLDNQERILSRMLDAQKSLHKREYSRKREGKAGEDFIRKSPSPLPDDLGQRRDVLQRDLLKVLSEPYPTQYEDAIRDYFKILQTVDMNTEQGVNNN